MTGGSEWPRPLPHSLTNKQTVSTISIHRLLAVCLSDVLAYDALRCKNSKFHCDWSSGRC